MASVKAAHGDLKSRGVVDAVEIDAPSAGMGPRLVETLDAAEAAKEMFGRAGSKPVAAELVPAGNESKSLVGHDQVAKARH